MSDQRHALCPSCGAVNRVAVGRERQATCGKCSSRLLAGAVHEVDAAGFERFLAKSDLPLLVDFWAPWCGPCKMMGPQFEAAAGQLAGQAVALKVNTEREQALAGRYAIQSIPTLALFINGREHDRQPGAQGADSIVAWTRARL